MESDSNNAKSTTIHYRPLAHFEQLSQYVPVHVKLFPADEVSLKKLFAEDGQPIRDSSMSMQWWAKYRT